MAVALPKLAVFWEDAAFSPLEIAQAARGLCRPVFVIGWSAQPVTFPLRLLGRLGDVVSLPGAGPAQAISALESSHLDGVIVFTDTPQCLAAAVAEHFGLRSHSPATALMLSDKLAQRQALSDAGLPIPAFWAVERATVVTRGAQALPADVRFPAVLKPRRGAGGRDTFLVRDRAELELRAAQCEDEDLLLEEYIADCEPAVSALGSDVFSVETLVEEGRAHHICATGRFRFQPPFREAGAFLPSDLGPRDVDAAFALAGSAAKALGVVSGALHTEIKLSPSGPLLVEVNGRVGGNIPAMMQRIGGPPFMALAMRLALGLPLGEPAPLASRPVSYLRWFRAPVGAGRVEAVEGADEARCLPGVHAVRVKYGAGDKIPWGARLDADFVVEVDGQVPDHAALSLLTAQLNSTLRLRFSA